MRKISILVVITASTFLSSYGFASCVKGIRGCLGHTRSNRASYASLESVRWYPGKRVVNARQNNQSTRVNVRIGVESYPVPE